MPVPWPDDMLRAYPLEEREPVQRGRVAEGSEREFLRLWTDRLARELGVERWSQRGRKRPRRVVGVVEPSLLLCSQCLAARAWQEAPPRHRRVTLMPIRDAD